MNQFNIVKIYTIFTQQQGTNSIFMFPKIINQETLEHIQGHKTRCKNFVV